MKKMIFLFSIISLNLISIAQNTKIDKVTSEIEAEGKKLYKSEMASWYGTDIFLENYKKTENIQGYFSYLDNGVAKCVFVSKGELPKVIGTISFDSSYNTKTAKTDLSERELTKFEQDLFSIRTKALQIINQDTIFKIYQNTSLNLVPLISNEERKVYVLTGPKENGVVVFGNDYLLTFDSNNELIAKKQLHKNIIWIDYGQKKEGENEIVGAMHTHLPETGDFITATDICTLMLYEKFAKWKQHTVISVNYVSIWNCQTDELVILSKEVIDKINKDQETKKKKGKD